MTAPVDHEAPRTRTKPKDRGSFRVVGEDEVDPRPEILLTPNVHETTHAMIGALGADLDLFQGGAGNLVHVTPSEADDALGAAAGTPVIRSVPLSWLTDRVSMHSVCKTRSKEGNWKHVPPPGGRVKAVLERGEWPFRQLDGVIEAPSLRPDGSILQTPGYDAATRSLYVPNANFAAVPESPTHGDAVLAYAHLAEVFCDFPYVEISHRSATVAAILTILARTAIRGAVPCWLFDAANKRSGKSLQVNVVSIIATGRPAPTMTFPSEEEELEKVLAGFALRGARIVNFDNVARPFGGAALDKCVTAIDRVQLRMLGSNDMPDLAWRAVILASGNQVKAKGDMLPRVLSPRIESPLENPEGRVTFSRPDRAGEDLMCAWALEHRTELVADALTILRAYVVAGRPEPAGLPKWGGFGAWTSLIAGALVWAGAPSPLGARRGLEGDDDPRAEGEREFIRGWARLCQETSATSLTSSGALSHLYPAPKKDEPPDGFDDFREAIQVLTGAKPGYPPGSNQLSNVIRSLKNRPLAGLKLVKDGETSGSGRWRAVPTKDA